jgi:hypothetical protein
VAPSDRHDEPNGAPVTGGRWRQRNDRRSRPDDLDPRVEAQPRSRPPAGADPLVSGTGGSAGSFRRSRPVLPAVDPLLARVPEASVAERPSTTTVAEPEHAPGNGAVPGNGSGRGEVYAPARPPVEPAARPDARSGSAAWVEAPVARGPVETPVSRGPVETPVARGPVETPVVRGPVTPPVEVPPLVVPATTPVDVPAATPDPVTQPVVAQPSTEITGGVPAVDVAPAPVRMVPPPKPRAIVRWRRRRPRVRRVSRVVRRIDAWTVFKVAIVFWALLYVILLVAGVLLWNLALTTGTVSNVEGFIRDLFGLQTFEFDGDQMFRASWVLGAFFAVAGTGFTVTLAVVFNLIADLVGGVRVTVLEEEVVLRERPIVVPADQPPARPSG